MVFPETRVAHCFRLRTVSVIIRLCGRGCHSVTEKEVLVAFERRKRKSAMHLHHPVGFLSRLSRHRHIVGVAALSILSTAYPSYAFAETFSNKLHAIRGGSERDMNSHKHEANDPFSRSTEKVVIAGGTHGNEVRLVESHFAWILLSS